MPQEVAEAGGPLAAERGDLLGGGCHQPAGARLRGAGFRRPVALGVRLRAAGVPPDPFADAAFPPFGARFARGLGTSFRASSSGSSSPWPSQARVHAMQRTAPPRASTRTPPQAGHASASGFWFSAKSQSGKRSQE